MKRLELTDLLERIQTVSIGVLGDFCLDVYLLMEPAASEASLETGLATRPVRSQRYTLGGAGNVAWNLQAMGVKRISAFGVIGHDPFGKEMTGLLSEKGIDVGGLLMQGENWDTHVYMKPYEAEKEQHRLDFGGFNQLHPAIAELLLESVTAALPQVDLMIVNQQILRGIHTSEFRAALQSIINGHPEKTFVVDSRQFPDEYPGAIRMINAIQAARLLGMPAAAADLVDAAAMETLASRLYDRWGKPVFLTRGEHGCVVCDAGGFREIPGLLILTPTDPVGAGDSMLAGISAALATGARPYRAAELGSLVAGVTVQKLMQTGTASPDEILGIGAEPDHRYRPDLARNPRRARHLGQTDIEIAGSLPGHRHFTHVIFDHDGTISTLRQGWEEIMEPMMVSAILGNRATDADEALCTHVTAAVRSYIDRTTGIQTLAQMKGLARLVRQFKCVPEGEILDEYGYKKLYNDELQKMVNDRIRKLERGELGVEDFTVKKAVDFLRALHSRGMICYLASGTDQEDLEREAAILGCRDFFGDRLYGAVGDISREAKQIVLERILASIGDAPPGRILTFGDGPVEIRETHKKGGYTVGVASNEIRRYGLNFSKRTRLIEAGADLIIPDFCQMDQLLEVITEG